MDQGRENNQQLNSSSPSAVEAVLAAATAHSNQLRLSHHSESDRPGTFSSDGLAASEALSSGNVGKRMSVSEALQVIFGR
jgi:hypothetical protein